MYINEIFIQHQLYMFSPGELQKNDIMLIFDLTHGSKQNFSEIAIIKKSTT